MPSLKTKSESVPTTKPFAWSQQVKAAPSKPGVYLVYDKQDELIYVGQSGNLRRRLGSYQRATAQKKERKMRKIRQLACRLEMRTCTNELEALLLEARLIERRRPKLNIMGAYSHLYPYIGIKEEGGDLVVACSNKADALNGFSCFGAFRSRFLTRTSYFALLSLLRMVAFYHPVKVPLEHKKKLLLARFRQVNSGLKLAMHRFMGGHSSDFLTQLSILLLERPQARRRPKEIQELLRDLMWFYEAEAQPLREAIESSNFTGAYVAQADRDSLFIKSRHDPQADLSLESHADLWHGFTDELELD